MPTHCNAQVLREGPAPAFGITIEPTTTEGLNSITNLFIRQTKYLNPPPLFAGGPREFLMRAQSEEEQKRWMAALRFHGLKASIQPSSTNAVDQPEAMPAAQPGKAGEKAPPKEASPTTSSGAAVADGKTGYLQKRGGGTSVFGRKSWKRRFFVLDGPHLSYFETEDKAEAIKQPYFLPYISPPVYFIPKIEPRTNCHASNCFTWIGVLSYINLFFLCP
jgi:hypothetical protein